MYRGKKKKEEKGKKMLILGSHGKLQGRWKLRQMNPLLGQRRASPDARLMNPTSNRPGSNS